MPKTLCWALGARCPKTLTKHSGGHFPDWPLSTPVNGKGPVRCKWGFGEGLLKDKFAFFEAYKNPIPKRRKNCLQNAQFYRQKGPCLKRPLNWTRSIFPLLSFGEENSLSLTEFTANSVSSAKNSVSSLWHTNKYAERGTHS